VRKQNESRFAASWSGDMPRRRSRAGSGWTHVIVPDIFGEYAESVRQLLFDDERGLGDCSWSEIVGMKKFREHAAEAPAIV
jgi:hypothetical protein